MFDYIKCDSIKTLDVKFIEYYYKKNSDPEYVKFPEFVEAIRV